MKNLSSTEWVHNDDLHYYFKLEKNFEIILANQDRYLFSFNDQKLSNGLTHTHTD